MKDCTKCVNGIKSKTKREITYKCSLGDNSLIACRFACTDDFFEGKKQIFSAFKEIKGRG